MVRTTWLVLMRTFIRPCCVTVCKVAATINNDTLPFSSSHHVPSPTLLSFWLCSLKFAFQKQHHPMATITKRTSTGYVKNTSLPCSLCSSERTQKPKTCPRCGNLCCLYKKGGILFIGIWGLVQQIHEVVLGHTWEYFHRTCPRLNLWT